MTERRVVLVDSGCANVASVSFALERLGARPTVSARRETIEDATHVILPGVGSAVTFMARMNERGLVDCVRSLDRPVLGICLGMQVLFESSEEGDTETLGVLPGRVRRLPGGPGITIPHMGWNRLEVRDPSAPIVGGLGNSPYAYFVHGYFVPVSAVTDAVTHHGVEISAVVRRDNFHGCQFHPERSAEVGAFVLARFLDLS